MPSIADHVSEPWRWRHEESLAGLGVLCMSEATDGTLWFGSPGAISSYDGMTVTTFPFDEDLLSKITYRSKIPWANAILTLNDGRMLVLIGESLVLRHDGQWDVVIQKVGKSMFDASLVQAEDGAVWLFDEDALWRIDGDLAEASVVRKAPEDSVLRAFCLDAEQNLWVAEQSKENRMQLVQVPLVDGRPSTTQREFPVPFSGPCKAVHIAAGDDGLIWYADDLKASGLQSFDPARGVWLPQDSSTMGRSYNSVMKSRDGSIWCGAQGQLVHYVKGIGVKVYDCDKVRLPWVVLSLFETRDGRLWVIGRGGYVFSMDTGTSEWLTYDDLNFGCESGDGRQWFIAGVKNQVVSYDPRTAEWLCYGPEDGMINRPYVLFYSSHGLLWVAGGHEKRAAIAVFDGVRWQRHLHPEFALYVSPKAVFEAADGTVWFGAGGTSLAKEVPGSGGGLQYQVANDGSVRPLKHYAPPVFPYYVTSISQTAAQDVMWIGSTFIHRYDGQTTAQAELALQGENTVDMVVDRNQTLWVAKEHVGVCRKDAEGWTVFGMKEGIASLLLNDLCLLRDGTLLASSDMGISRFDGKTWTAHAYPKWFGMTKLLSGVSESSDGSIWLNYAYNEMWRFHKIGGPERLRYVVRHRPETDPPETQIVDYLERVEQTGNTYISWTGRDHWSRTPVEDLLYSWRLDDGEWSPFSLQPGHTFLDLDSGGHVLEVRARDQSFNVDPTPDRIEFKVIPPIWKQVWFIILISALTGLIAFLIGLLIRLRERSLIEQQKVREAFLLKQQAEKEKHLMELDQLKMGFFTNISHELRTPLTVIVGRLQTLFDCVNDDKIKDGLSIVLRNAQRVTTLINQLLDFRKIQEGKIRVEPTYGDLVPPLLDWVASLQVLAEKAGLTLVQDTPETCCGEFDFDKLQKIFTNLIANSIKYTKSGGEVRIGLKVVDASLQFTVEDTGVGIPEEHINHIFDRFYRVSEESMQVGAGIGLNLTQELVELLGGAVQVESPIHPDAERPGSRFTVRLPMEQVASDEGQVASEKASGESLCPLSPSPEADGEAPLILVVEDDEDVRDFIIEGLASVYRMDMATNGEEGLQKAKETVPDLIVTDVMMPVMDGMVLCRALKTSMETSHIPVIMLTAKTALESQIEGLKTGADDYITKPFHMELLQVRIANLLEARRLLREKFCNEYPLLTPNIPEDVQDKEFLERAMRVMDGNYSEEDFGPDAFARMMNMSLSTLHRKLKAVANRTPSAFINEFRMLRAAELLITTIKPVTEILFEVGCDEPANFTRMFKKYFNMSPSKYRSLHRPS